MVSFTLELSKMTEWMDQHSLCTRQALFLRVNSNTVCANLSAKLSIPMATSTLDSTESSKSMDLGKLFTLTGTYMKEDGKTTKRTE